MMDFKLIGMINDIDPFDEYSGRMLKKALGQEELSERALEWIGMSKKGRKKITKESFEWFEDAYVEVHIDLDVYGTWFVGLMKKKDLLDLINEE